MCDGEPMIRHWSLSHLMSMGDAWGTGRVSKRSEKTPCSLEVNGKQGTQAYLCILTFGGLCFYSLMRHRVLLWSPGQSWTCDYLVSVFQEVGLLLYLAALCTFNVCILPLCSLSFQARLPKQTEGATDLAGNGRNGGFSKCDSTLR